MPTKTSVLAALPPFVLGAYPIALVFANNANIVLLEPLLIVRFVIISWAAIALLLWLLRRVCADFQAAAMWLSWVLLLMMPYQPVTRLVWSAGLRVNTYTPSNAVVYALVVICLATVMTRPWIRRRRDPLPMVATTLTIFGLSVYQWVAVVHLNEARDWRGPADAMIRSAATPSSKPDATRDIFYIVLDGLGSIDTLRNDYDLDVGPFVEFLRSKGFYVPMGARSNYAQTYLSLASTLNMNYLDGLAKAMGPKGHDRRPLAYLIQENALMKLARHAGYHVVAISSDYQGTEFFSHVDTCVCPRYGLDEVEQRAIELTPLAALPMERWTFDAHRRKVLSSFSSIERLGAGPGPTFVFAHLVVPHPPFVFGPDGSPRRTSAVPAFTFGDGTHFPGREREYRPGYRDQTTFVLNRTKTIVETLLARRGSDPVIVIHGDHGPGLYLNWEGTPEETNMYERLGIFAAYRLPGDPGTAYSFRSPINGARTLARNYLGSKLPNLRDESFFSPFRAPYDLVRVLNDE